ncbi:MAG: hypothetical protein FJX72_21590 [Armatimonadetes bacterium]|nr:hypothetical protein [Armatimonadota bacterium]
MGLHSLQDMGAHLDLTPAEHQHFGNRQMDWVDDTSRDRAGRVGGAGPLDCRITDPLRMVACNYLWLFCLRVPGHRGPMLVRTWNWPEGKSRQDRTRELSESKLTWFLCVLAATRPDCVRVIG